MDYGMGCYQQFSRDFPPATSGNIMETQWDMEREMTKKMTRGCPEMMRVENNHEKCWFNGI